MSKKIFAVNNGSETDFELNKDMVAEGSNAHSGGAIIIADSLEEAQELLKKAIGGPLTYNYEGSDSETVNIGTLKEIKLNKSGILLFADGDC